ncbi:Uncharacterised protein [Enterobacter roggenkampii]|uniref:Uncharacterized protein n=1 Tax=Enterobacter roggenkampii TaxID=1812935 RepID=A0ABY0J4Z8_9ENTR|nr:Uncharacterised protein [Enterobacter roggenkampii]SAB00009.1 Uncharacterised protein [Enterobacter roggenkampii]
MRENHATGTDGDNHQLRAHARGGNQRRNDAACGDRCNGRRTQRNTQNRGNRPGHQERRHVGFMHHGSDVFVHAAVDQNLFERTATADDQQHHGNDFDGRGQRVVDLIHGAAAVQTESEHRDQHGNQRCHHRVTQEFCNGQERMTFWQNHLCHGAHRHQDHRYQRGPDADAKARHLFFGEGFGAVQTFRNRLINAFQEAGINRACQNHRWDRQNRTEQQGFTHVGVEDGRDSGWARVRRQEAVGHGQRRGHWHTDIQQRDARGSRNGEHQRQHQHEAYFIEQRETNGKAG